MFRFAFAALLAALTGLATHHAGTPLANGQDKPAKKAKKGKAASLPENQKDDLSRVLPVFDPGSHTQPISAMGFTGDGRKLVTVGQDFTIQVWNSGTGDRLDILRLPGYGREKGFDPGRWDVAAVSADGTRVAIGGQAKFLFDPEAKANAPARLLLIDLAKRRVMRVQLFQNVDEVVGLAFSRDGESLAVGLGKGPTGNNRLFLVAGLSARMDQANPLLGTLDCTFTVTPHKTPVTTLAFAPDGKRLAAGEFKGQKLTLWDVPDGAAPVPKLAKELSPGTDTMGLAWSPDGKQFVHTLKDNSIDGRVRGFDVRTADGELIKPWRIPDLSPALGKGFVTLFGIRYLDANTLYVVANGGGGAGDGGGTIAVVVDLAAGKARRLGLHTEGMVTVPVGAAAAGGKLVAYTVSGNTEVLVGPSGGAAPVRCGQRSPVPYYLGWSKDPARPGFAWTPTRGMPRGQERDPAILRHGFDLARVEPVGEVRGDQYDTARWKHGEWSLKFVGAGAKAPDDGFRGPSRLMKGDKPVSGFPVADRGTRTLIPNGDQPPLVALATHPNYEPERGYIYQADGSVAVRLLPGATTYTDMVSSPDGRFLLCTTGTPRIDVYRTNGSPYPLLSYAQLNGEWVCWTPEGYYAASPGGEKMFGWAINNGPNQFVTFHPAERYSKQFRRPGVIQLAIEKGSVWDALEALSTPPTDVEKILPPEVKLELVRQTGSTVEVRGVSAAGPGAKPVLALRVLLDGRPVPGGKGALEPVGGSTPEGVFTFDVPAGLHELKLLARTEDGSAVSAPLVVRGPKVAGSQPVIHRVCVGINEYDDGGLKLGAAVPDARAMFDALGRDCVGPDNRFGAAGGELILDKSATRDRVLKALAAVQEKAKGGDLVVVFFAGHGVKQKDAFYLLTREADVSKDLKDKSLSGDDLRAALKDIECPVLLILDACHSAGAVRSFRPATDDLTRALTDDTVGVTVMSAAMAHETAGATTENGHFTAGLLKALKAGEGVPFDPYERQLYVHHLYSVAYSEVRRATNGKQNPFLNMPWTTPPLPVREVLGK